jgi:hypothetical protein
MLHYRYNNYFIVDSRCIGKFILHHLLYYYYSTSLVYHILTELPIPGKTPPQIVETAEIGNKKSSR